MKLSKRAGAIIEWIIAAVLLVICIKVVLPYASISPLKVLEKVEKADHYGPSEIVKSIDDGNERLYLGRYKDWCSATTVKRKLFLWHEVSTKGGYLIDYSKDVSYYWTIDDGFLVCGYVNNPEIITLEIGEESYCVDEHRMFIFRQEIQDSYTLRGFNKDGRIIYEENIQ